MDPFEIVNNMSSYQMNEWAAATGLPPESMIPSFFGILGVYVLALLAVATL